MASEQLLIDMGFPKEQIDNALKVCGDSTEQAMEWLLAHAGDAKPDTNTNANETAAAVEPMETTTTETTVCLTDDQDAMENVSTEQTESIIDTQEKPAIEGEAGVMYSQPIKQEEAKSIKCDECNKLFKSPEEVEFHAVKSGHSSFSESSEEKKALTDEEKKEKLLILEEKMRHRRKQKEEEDRVEVVQREKKRIQMGKNISENKQKMIEKEIRLLAEERRREKVEDKLARQRVKEQIERDKLERKEKFSDIAAAPIVPERTLPVITAPKKEYDTARIQVRLPSGSPLVEEFKAKEPLSAVRLWVKLNRKDTTEDPQRSFTLSTTFPRKIFTEEDMDKPLNSLGLTPSAVLVINDIPSVTIE